MVEGVNTGVPGLDDLISGGVPKGSTTLIAGDAGTGKTVLASQFVNKGLENEETCLYLTTEELPENIIQDAEQFGWGFKESENFKIQYVSPTKGDRYLQNNAEKMIEKLDPDRIVIDSLSALLDHASEQTDTRTIIHDLLRLMKENGVTTLVTGEAPGEHTRSNLAEFVVEGVIKLDAKPMGNGLQRTLTVKKMRSTPIDGSISDLVFTDQGLKIE